MNTYKTLLLNSYSVVDAPLPTRYFTIFSASLREVLFCQEEQKEVPGKLNFKQLASGVILSVCGLPSEVPEAGNADVFFVYTPRHAPGDCILPEDGAMFCLPHDQLHK